MEKVQLSQEEIEILTNIQNTQTNIINSLGQLEYSIQLLELQKESLTEQIEQLKESEKKVGQDLNEKYGNGNIDLNTGFFTPTESNLETS